MGDHTHGLASWGHSHNGGDNYHEHEPKPAYGVCVECGRRFDLTNEDDASEWFYGHDCES